MEVDKKLRGRLQEMEDEINAQQEMELAIASLAAAKPALMATEDEERRISQCPCGFESSQGTYNTTCCK